ncbi:hypothetical protein DKL61_02290 [Gammaproteobacteria bacterium ESL0073]|nr:hypothetical protein DKL61_02290 [Gammaproteobacteria bacterium ESL0073]
MSYEYLTESGVIVPDTSDTRKQVVTEWKQALGQDLITDDETPQGLLINAETEARQSVARANAAIANQINPNIAEGIFLDAIWALTGGQRLKASYTQVQGVILTGVAGTVIVEGSLAQASDYQFKTLSTVVLNASGKAVVNFQAVELGVVPCLANQLNKIITPILGWETVNNPRDGVMGKDEESDLSARLRRKRTLALQGRALPEAIVSDLYSLEGVKSLVFRENISNTYQIVDGVPFELKPHSIWVCIEGGSDNQIAQSLLNSKSLGAGYNGQQKLEVIELVSGQSYEVQFDRPENVLIYIKVTVKASSSTFDPQLVIPNVIMNYAKGEQAQEQGFMIGSTVSSFEIAAAINKEYPSLFIKKIEISTDAINYSSQEIEIALNQIAETSEGLIRVVSE